MRIIELGAIQIAVTKKTDDVMNVDICAETKSDVIHMETQKDETIDSFCSRLRSMLRTIYNSEPRKVDVADKKVERKKKPTFEEQKKDITMVIE